LPSPITYVICVTILAPEKTRIMDESLQPESGLRGLRILIVEDEYYLADDLAAALKGAGAEVLGPAGTLEDADQAVLAGGFDCAVVDMNLRGDMAFPIADRLQAASIPFLIATGYNSASLPDRFADVPRVEKPSDTGRIVAAIPALLQGCSRAQPT
jgi:DNA-binding response OmpR family regulator